MDSVRLNLQEAMLQSCFYSAYMYCVYGAIKGTFMARSPTLGYIVNTYNTYNTCIKCACYHISSSLQEHNSYIHHCNCVHAVLYFRAERFIIHFWT
jgi:hypothetical protein